MTHRRLARLGAAMMLALGLASGTLGLAATAHAAPRLPVTAHRVLPAYYQEVHFIRYDPYTTPPQIAAEHYLTCPPPVYRCGLSVTIYRLENGSWVKVATGETVAVVYCSGSFSTTYKDQSGDEVTAPCS